MITGLQTVITSRDDERQGVTPNCGESGTGKIGNEVLKVNLVGTLSHQLSRQAMPEHIPHAWISTLLVGLGCLWMQTQHAVKIHSPSSSSKW